MPSFLSFTPKTAVKKLITMNILYTILHRKSIRKTTCFVILSRKRICFCGIIHSNKGKVLIHLKRTIKKWLRPALFTLGGALTGLGYYYTVGCSAGSCPITSNPIITMLYMGLIGWLLSGVFGKECDGGCHM